MRKMLFVLCVLFMVTIPVLAQTDDAPEIMEWGELEKTFNEEGFTGEFHEFDEIGLKLLVPGEMTERDLSDALKQNGYLGYFRNDDASMCLTVFWAKLNAPQTPAEFAKTRAEQNADAEIVGFYQINGIDAVVLSQPNSDPAMDWLICILDGPEENFLTFIQLNPSSTEKLVTLSQFIFGSVQSLEN